MEASTIDLYSSFAESPQGTDKGNNSEGESENESVFEEYSLDKIKQAYDPNVKNIVEMTASLDKNITF